MKHIKKFNNLDQVSEGLKYHIDNKISLSESIYRIESTAWLNLINEARILYRNNQIELSENDIWIVESNIGSYGYYNGKSVLLDVPFLEDITAVDIDLVKNLWNDGVTDPIEIKKQISFRDISVSDINDIIDDLLNEATHNGKNVKLNKPFRTSGESKKFAVYTKNKKGNIVKVRFGDPNLKIKNNNAKRAKSFRARHGCDNPGPRWKAKYWSCNVGRYAKLLGLKSNRPW